MSEPAPQEPRHDGRWETIRYALDSNARAPRLCLIWLVAIAAPVAAAAVAELIRHTLLCGARAVSVMSARPRLHHPAGGGGPGLGRGGRAAPRLRARSRTSCIDPPSKAVRDNVISATMMSCDQGDPMPPKQSKPEQAIGNSVLEPR
jgi:hypothetical protein